MIKSIEIPEEISNGAIGKKRAHTFSGTVKGIRFFRVSLIKFSMDIRKFAASRHAYQARIRLVSSMYRMLCVLVESE